MAYKYPINSTLPAVPTKSLKVDYTETKITRNIQRGNINLEERINVLKLPSHVIHPPNSVTW